MASVSYFESGFESGIESSPWRRFQLCQALLASL